MLATDLRATRDIVVVKNGSIYAKLSKRKHGKGMYGIIDETKLFGDYPDTGVVINEDLNATIFKIEYRQKSKLGLKD